MQGRRGLFDGMNQVHWHPNTKKGGCRFFDVKCVKSVKCVKCVNSLIFDSLAAPEPMPWAGLGHGDQNQIIYEVGKGATSATSLIVRY